MVDPKPIKTLVGLAGLAVVSVTLWFLSWPLGNRLTCLLTIAREEQGFTEIPAEGFAHVAWLVMHRLPHFKGLLGLGLMAAVIGLAEGERQRRIDPLGGWRITRWTTGVVLLALVACVVALLHVVPVSLARWPVAWGLAGLLGLAGYCLGHGRPYAP